MNDAERLAHLRECLCQHFTRDGQQECEWCFLLRQLDDVTAERAACLFGVQIAGAGTVGVVATRLDRSFIGIELNAE